MSKKIREELGIYQKKLAEYIGTNQTEVSFIERGFIPESNSKIETIMKLFNEVINNA